MHPLTARRTDRSFQKHDSLPPLDELVFTEHAQVALLARDRPSISMDDCALASRAPAFGMFAVFHDEIIDSNLLKYNDASMTVL
jgi:hypothetical protein